MSGNLDLRALGLHQCRTTWRTTVVREAFVSNIGRKSRVSVIPVTKQALICRGMVMGYSMMCVGLVASSKWPSWSRMNPTGSISKVSLWLRRHGNLSRIACERLQSDNPSIVPLQVVFLAVGYVVKTRGQVVFSALEHNHGRTTWRTTVVRGSFVTNIGRKNRVSVVPMTK